MILATDGDNCTPVIDKTDNQETPESRAANASSSRKNSYTPNSSTTNSHSTPENRGLSQSAESAIAPPKSASSPQVDKSKGASFPQGEGAIAFTVGLVTATKGSVQKRILSDGSKDGSHSLSVSKGIYQNVSLTGLHGFAELLQGIKPNQAITLGTAKIDGELNLYTNAVYEQLPDKSRAIARTKDCIHWPEGERLLVIDHDPEPGKPDLNKDEFWNDTVNVIPELAGVGRLTTTSTSSGIYDRATGECLKAENGHHTYIIVCGDVGRFVEIYKTRCWAKGKAFFKLANPNQSTGTSSILERFPSDTAVFSPERLVYEAGALLPSTLEQRRSAPHVIEGDVLNLDAIPDLTDEEKATAAANKTAARNRIEAKQLRAATKAIAATGHKQPKTEARRRIALCKSGLLEPSHILDLAEGGTLRVEDIGPEHDGLLLKDPQEPKYRNGAQVAKLYWNGDKPWRIHSEAHGGANYSAAPVTKSCANPWDELKRYPKAPILIRERRSHGLSVEAAPELTTITVSGFFALYQNVAQTEGGRERALLPEMTKAATPGRKVYLQISSEEVDGKITGSRIAFGGLLGKRECDVFVTETGTHLKDQSQRFTRWRSDRFAQMQRDRNPKLYGLTTPHRILSDRQWVDFELPSPGTALFLSADCGRGKTTAMQRALIELFKVARNAQVEDMNYRISLGLQKVEVFNTAFAAEQVISGSSMPLMVHISSATNRELNTAKAVSYCIDSLLRRTRLIKAAVEAGRRVVVLLDELDGDLKHLFQGGTLKSRQAKVVSEFAECLRLVMANGGNIIGGEANLTQCSVDVICTLTAIAPDKVTVLENTVKSQSREIYFHSALNDEGKPSDNLLRRMAFMDALRAVRGEDIRKAPLTQSLEDVIEELDQGDRTEKSRLFYVTTSQTNAERLEVEALKLGYKVDRHDGKTAAENFSKAFRQNPNAYIEEHQPDIVIINHSLESGISIDVKGYFDIVILDGDRLESRALLQLPMRLRDPVPIHAYVNERSQMARTLNATDQDGILKEYDAYANDCAGHAKVEQHFGKANVDQALEKARNGIGQQFHHYKALYESRLANSDNGLRAHLALDLQKAGHQLIYLPESAIEGVYSAEDIRAYKEASEAVKKAEAQLYKDQPGDLSLEDAKRILRSNKSTYPEKVNAKKSLDRHNYPCLLTPDGDSAFDDLNFIREEIVDGRYSKIKAHELCWMQKHPAVASKLDLNSWASQMNSAFPVLPAIKNLTARLQLGSADVDGEKSLSLADLIIKIGESGANCFDDKYVVAVARIAIAHRELINRHYRISIHPETPPEIIANKLLRKFGYDSQRSKRRQLEDGSRRYDFIIKPMAHQASVWAALDRKWADDLHFVPAETQAQKETSHFRNTNISVNENATRAIDPRSNGIISAMKMARAREDLERIAEKYDRPARQAAWTALIECDRAEALRIEALVGGAS